MTKGRFILLLANVALALPLFAVAKRGWGAWSDGI